jgi:hypothetical protein
MGSRKVSFSTATRNPFKQVLLSSLHLPYHKKEMHINYDIDLTIVD